MDKIYLKLNDKQAKAFKKFEKAWKECLNENILLVNVYSCLHGYDRQIVADYADNLNFNESDPLVIRAIDAYCMNTFDIVHEWTDDQHLIKLTPKGKQLLDADEL